MSQPKDLQAQADRIAWFHSIDLGNGVRTRGASANSFPLDQFPPFAGRTVLDIGSWDGKNAFLAERMGATRVVALDHYVWGVDMEARGRYWSECHEAGKLPDHNKDLTDFWRPDLPGQAGFKFAKGALGSSVEPVLADFMTTDLASLGTFDVVLYLGVLYHVKEPLTALERVRQVTREVAMIETEAIWLAGSDTMPLIDFFAADDVNSDFGTWFVPTLPALHRLCKAAGFSTVRTIVGPPSGGLHDGTGQRATHYRALVHAFV